ncbi:MAG: hypothetical protein HOJ79_02045 [Nitrospina sp.]|jgi:hypothetical protein|nr:hypothetical protein [Nitrospina sp.]
MRHYIKILIQIAIVLTFSSNALGQSHLPPVIIEEPDLKTQLSWDIATNGLLYVSYDLDGNGKADYFTLRVVSRNYRSYRPTERVYLENPSHLVFFVSYGSSNHYYLAVQRPLFYAFDVNEDDHWDVMYKDVLEDGVNGNEEFYDSPSGMF